MPNGTSTARSLPLLKQPCPRPGTLRWRWKDGAVVVFFWGLFVLHTLAQDAFDPRFGLDGGLHQGEALQTFLKFSVWAVLTPGIFWMSSHFTPGHRAWLRLVPLYLLVGIILAVAADLVDHILWNTLVPEGPPRPVSIMFVLSGFHVLGEFSIFFFLLMVGFARIFFLRYQENEQESVQLQAHLAEARLQALRMQINPHFLFNTLHVISDNFEENPRTARRMIARLSEILRYTFEETEAREVTLGKEMQFLDGYLDIQRSRFEDKLNVTQDIAQDVREALIPNLILQPLVENAIKHGVSQLEGPGQITIRAWREDETLHLMVSDNGPGLAREPAKNGTSRAVPGVGLRNTRERLAGLYGESHSFVVASPPAGGFTTHIALPFHTHVDLRVTAVDVA